MMIGLDAKTCAAVMDGVLRGKWPEEDALVSGVAIDSRKVAPGQLFVALSGERVDGHNYVGQALAKGAAAALVERPVTADGPLIQVDNTLTALQKLANWHRRQLAVPVVAVTGSCGKTTTKDLLAAALSGALSVLKTQGNYNNELGLPLTLLGLNASHQVAVLEMGMRGLGQIAELCAIAEPTIGVLTNVGTVHMELLGSQAAIAQAKGELLEALPADGWAVINGGDPWVRQVALQTAARVLVTHLADDPVPDDRLIKKLGARYAGTLTASRASSVENQQTIQLHYQGPAELGVENGFCLTIPLAGRHNAANALLALGVGLALNIPLTELAAGLTTLALSAMRQEIVQFEGVSVINDAYNANPEAMQAALRLLKDLAKNARTIALLGDMAELGPFEEEGHRQVGRELAKLGIDGLIAVGPRASWIAEEARAARVPLVRHTLNKGEAANWLREVSRPGDWALLKGSRSMSMETVLETILESCKNK